MMEECTTTRQNVQELIPLPHALHALLLLSVHTNAPAHKRICTTVEQGVASPILNSVGFAVMLKAKERGIRTQNAPISPCAVSKILNAKQEEVTESLYISF